MKEPLLNEFDSSELGDSDSMNVGSSRDHAKRKRDAELNPLFGVLEDDSSELAAISSIKEGSSSYHRKRKRDEGSSTSSPNELGALLSPDPEIDPLLGVLNANARPRTTHLLVEGRDGGYMPPIGSVPGFVAKPKTPVYSGNVLTVVAPMGCGKSRMVSQYLYDDLKKQRSTRILYLTANRTYATSAAVELRKLVERLKEEGYNITIGCYMQNGIDLSLCQICLCSLESLHRVDLLRFDIIIADEVSSIARIVGGGTLPGYNNVYLLRDLCSSNGARVLALDADLKFKMVNSSPTTIVDDFLQLICPGRPVVQVGMSTPTPTHLQREVRGFFDNRACDGKAGKEEWFAKIDGRVAEWHATGGESGRLIITVGTKQFGRKICQRLLTLRIPFRFYHGDSSQRQRYADFEDPVTAWEGVGAIVVTTVLAIGVDIPSSIKVCQVFAFFARMGCTFQQMCQSLLRARHVVHPEIHVLIDCMPPQMRELTNKPPIVHLT